MSISLCAVISGGAAGFAVGNVPGLILGAIFGGAASYGPSPSSELELGIRALNTTNRELELGISVLNERTYDLARIHFERAAALGSPHALQALRVMHELQRN